MWLVAAASRANQKLEANDTEGRTMWLRLGAAIRELQRRREEGEALN